MSESVKALGMALGGLSPEKWGGKPPTACCTSCEEPLIATCKWPYYEFVCLGCGKHLGFVEPMPKRHDTPGLAERLEELQAEWDEVKDRSIEELNEWLSSRTS